MAKQILVIDDEKSIRDSFLLALEETEFLVDTASSGEEGVAKFKSGAYDLIFLDLKMPGMDGIETLRVIRKINPKVPVYIVTAFSQEYFQELEVLTKEGIAFELMRKPIGLEQIETLVRAVLK